ncbi:hypothetical protein Tco_1331811 [Tanacetum coccineum]
MYVASLKSGENYKAQPYQYASPSKHILKAKAKPYPPCTQCGFNDHHPDNCQNYPECAICGSYDHFTSGHNRNILVKRGVLVESSDQRTCMAHNLAVSTPIPLTSSLIKPYLQGKVDTITTIFQNLYQL